MSNKKPLTKSEKRVVIIMSIVAAVALSIFAALVYINDYYEATEKAKKAILGNDNIQVTAEVTDMGGYYLFDSPENTEKGIIFYPGGKVDEVAYAPLMLALAEAGYDVYLVKMPAKLAIFGMNAAENIMKEASGITEWTMMGHSLGGAMAASFSASHDEEVDNLVLLAAYSTENLNGLDMDVYSFYGTEDKVLNMEKYKECYANFPEDVVEHKIDGGNHAYYAHYGEQEGDGTATITREEQQQTVLDIFVSLELGIGEE